MSTISQAANVCGAKQIKIQIDKNSPALRQQCLDEWNKMRDEMIDEARRQEASGEKDERFGAKYAAIPRPMKKSTE
jgi:hypothetical protein